MLVREISIVLKGFLHYLEKIILVQKVKKVYGNERILIFQWFKFHFFINILRYTVEGNICWRCKAELRSFKNVCSLQVQMKIHLLKRFLTVYTFQCYLESG